MNDLPEQDAHPLENFEDDFSRYVVRIVNEETLASLSGTSQIEIGVLRELFTTLIAEARHTIRLIEGEDLRGKRLLEIGSGPGVTSCFLAQRGVDIISLEPGGIGFEPYRRLALEIRRLAGVEHKHLSIPAEELNSQEHGYFDLIFSNNVMEHVPSADVCLSVLHSVLPPGGKMIHNCANYLVPYDPHFGIPLVPFVPSLTKWFLPKSIAGSDVWKSLNFISSIEVARCGRKNRAQVEFQRGIMYQNIVRLGEEPEFRERHALLAKMLPLLRVTGALALLRVLPPGLCTPMVWSWTRRD